MCIYIYIYNIYILYIDIIYIFTHSNIYHVLTILSAYYTNTFITYPPFLAKATRCRFTWCGMVISKSRSLRGIIKCIRNMRRMIVAVSPAPGWGFVWSMVASRVFHGLAPSPPPSLSLWAGMWKRGVHSVSPRCRSLRRTGGNNSFLPRLHMLMRRKCFVNGFWGHF